MAENKNKIVLHCCGGTGISLSDKAIKDYTQLGETLPKYEFNYIDTSDANIKKIEKLGDFWQIKSKLLMVEIYAVVVVKELLT